MRRVRGTKVAATFLAVALTLEGCTTTVAGDPHPPGDHSEQQTGVVKEFDTLSKRIVDFVSCLALDKAMGTESDGNDRFNNDYYRNGRDQLPDTSDDPQRVHVEASRRAYIFNPSGDHWGQIEAEWVKQNQISDFAALYAAGPVDASSAFWQNNQLNQNGVKALPDSMRLDKISLWATGYNVYFGRQDNNVVQFTRSGPVPMQEPDMQTIARKASEILSTLNGQATTHC